MEFLFSQLKKMDVVSVTDGKNLGKVCDIAFLFPENKVKGIFVTGCKGFKFTRTDVFIPISDVVRIGEDVVLVRTAQEKPPKGRPQPDCPPQPHCPPPCPPQPHCPPQNGNYPPQPHYTSYPPAGGGGRNFDDYE